MMIIKHLGMQPYQTIWEQMKAFTLNRQEDSPDEIWILEHPPVYTQGQAGKAEHILNPGQIPVIQSDRGGQVTYHGPGQMVAYFLIDIDRRKIGVRTLVCLLERALINLLSEYQIKANLKDGAPGVYVNEHKIASIGLRVKNGRTYHGIALNVDMDLKPFAGINPCGFAKMEMTQISAFYPEVQMEVVAHQFADHCLKMFSD